ncbi:MAG: response regulator, partial [Candidatus Omnitrophota bacterium]
DLVTMDIIMRDKSGLDGVKEIINVAPDAKILMISAMGQQAMVVDAIHAGAKGFVVKPFKPEVLLDEIKRIIG